MSTSFSFLLLSLLILSTDFDALVVLGQEHGSVLLSGERLTANQYLKNGQFTLVMQDDCNLVVYDNGDAAWSSRTGGQGTDCYLTMQYDGNLVVYDGNGYGHWAMATQSLGSSWYACVLQKDRRVSIYGGIKWGFYF